MDLGLIKKDTKIDFISMSKYMYTFSILMVVLFIVSFFAIGYNWGIDFKGGAVVDIKVNNEYKKTDLESTMKSLNVSDFLVKEFNDDNIQVVIGSNAVTAENFPKFLDSFKSKLSTKIYTITQTQFVGPSVSKDLLINGIWATLLSLFVIFIYVWIRFDWQYGFIAMLTLFHDSLTCLAFVSVFKMELNLTAIAAILTVIAYSINDTVVLYDQVRENLRRYAKESVATILNKSINQVLSRSISTVLTVVLVLFSVFLLGGSTLHVFSFILLVGCIFGTYSSICISVPLLMYLGDIKKFLKKTNKTKSIN